MNPKKTTVLTLLFICISLFNFAQVSLHVNGKPLDNHRCVDIRTTNQNLDSIQQIRKDILDAIIIDDCLELKIIYGGCNGNIELITDGKIKKSSKSKLNFNLNWIEAATCKALMQIYVTFDLAPYKKLIQDNNAVISIIGTDIEIKYKD